MTALRWKRNPLPKGLARMGSPQMSMLRDPTGKVYATTQQTRDGWGWYTMGLPPEKSANRMGASDAYKTEDEARAAALAFVRAAVTL